MNSRNVMALITRYQALRSECDDAIAGANEAAQQRESSLQAECQRLETERDAARHMAALWKRAAKQHRRIALFNPNTVVGVWPVSDWGVTLHVRKQAEE